MPFARRRSKPCLNTSIRFKKNVSALNTSRKILQKSMNCSMLRAASLKSNNASLAKKVAELQLELGAQRTAAREAAIESCRLQMQVARFQPLLEARDQLKDSLLQLRELLATMLDTDMAVMRCVNEMASIVEGPENGGDKSFSNTTAWFSDTILEMSNLIRFDKTLRDTSRAVPSPILPPKRQRTAVTSAHDPLLGGIPQGSTHSPEILSAVNTSRRTVQSISPPVVINLSNSVTNPPEPKHTPTSQSCQEASDSSFPDQPNVIIQV
ncbi:hypothetical protein D915_000858 [Fasciola hepatica]|uniref:Uncharacterized protein n=1 Tax=Fasciola hepatica TaxID=6192 RepID=A0A4E0RQZ7_FASHE|nr:hypothetical protein D915_000858 [Fasciola hepatica]